MGSLRCLRHRGQPKAWSSDPGSDSPPPSGWPLPTLSCHLPAAWSSRRSRGPLPVPQSQAAWPDVSATLAWARVPRVPGWGRLGTPRRSLAPRPLAATFLAQATLGEVSGPGLQAAAEGDGMGLQLQAA